MKLWEGNIFSRVRLFNGGGCPLVNKFEQALSHGNSL